MRRGASAASAPCSGRSTTRSSERSARPGWVELCQLGDEIRGVPQTGVLLEVGVVVGAVEDLSSRLVVRQFPQGEGSAGDVLSEGLTGVVILAIEADGVVHGEPEVLGEPLRDEAQLQEEPDGAPAQALSQASGIADGEVVELAGGVEAAFEDQ